MEVKGIVHFSSISILSRVYFRKVMQPVENRRKRNKRNRTTATPTDNTDIWQCGKKNDPCFPFNIDLYGRNRTKPRMQSEMRQVLEGWNTPARLVSFPTIRYVYETSAYSDAFETNSRYTDYESPMTSGFRFNTKLYGGFGPTMR